MWTKFKNFMYRVWRRFVEARMESARRQIARGQYWM